VKLYTKSSQGLGAQVAARGAAEEDRGAGDAGQDAQGQAEDECARGRQEADAAVEGAAQAQAEHGRLRRATEVGGGQ